MKGVYSIFFQLPQIEIEVGKLGKQLFPAGTYVYVGSGMGGVTARVRRHLCGSLNKRWHIDYVLAEATCKKAIIFATENKHMECLLSRSVFSLLGSQMVMRGLGSSDCSCDTHLYLLNNGMQDASNIVLKGCPKSEILFPDSNALNSESSIVWQSYK